MRRGCGYKRELLKTFVFRLESSKSRCTWTRIDDTIVLELSRSDRVVGLQGLIFVEEVMTGTYRIRGGTYWLLPCADYII